MRRLGVIRTAGRSADHVDIGRPEHRLATRRLKWPVGYCEPGCTCNGNEKRFFEFGECLSGLLGDITETPGGNRPDTFAYPPRSAIKNGAEEGVIQRAIKAFRCRFHVEAKPLHSTKRKGFSGSEVRASTQGSAGLGRLRTHWN